MTTPTQPSPSESTAPGDAGPVRRSGTRAAVWAAMGATTLLLIGALALVVAVAVSDGSPAAGEYRVVIPQGTGAKIDGGQKIELIPADLELRVGTTFVIQNEDNRIHTVGPFSVRPGETLTHRFDQAGVYKGMCTVHPSGAVTITVT